MTTAHALVEDLKRPWRHGEHADLNGLVLDEPLVLDGLQVRGLDLSGAVLNGGFSARGTHFRGLAWLRGTQISGSCDLEGAQFRTDLRADGLRASVLNLRRSRLQGVLSLAEAQLDKLALNGALVMANATLENAKISEVDMTECEVMGGLWTAGAELVSLTSQGADISGRIRLPISNDLRSGLS